MTINQNEAKLPFNTNRGTAAWGIKRFKEDALVKLMLDLFERESSGLEDEQCKIVTKSLEKISIQLSAIPDKFWIRSSIMDAFDKFKETYIKWNEINGADEKEISARRKALKKMSGKRHKLATVIRKNQYILSQALDLKLVENMYEALGAIPKLLPELFINLAKALARFHKKKIE